MSLSWCAEEERLGEFMAGQLIGKLGNSAAAKDDSAWVAGVFEIVHFPKSTCLKSICIRQTSVKMEELLKEPSARVGVVRIRSPALAKLCVSFW